MFLLPLTVPDAIALAERTHHRDPVKRLLADQRLEVARAEDLLAIVWSLPCGHDAGIMATAYTPEAVIEGLDSIVMACKCTNPAKIAESILARRPS